MTDLMLPFGLDFEDLYHAKGLARVDDLFLQYLEGETADLHQTYTSGRKHPDMIDAKAESDLLIAVAPYMETFVAALFGIEESVLGLKQAHENMAPLFDCKRLFVQRQAARAHNAIEAETFDGDEMAATLESHFGEPLTEFSFATHALRWMADKDTHADAFALALRYAAWALHAPAGRQVWGESVLFQVPEKRSPENLIELGNETIAGLATFQTPDGHTRERCGFDLTDTGTDLKGALDQANYCIWCHKQGKDSCAKGLRDRKTGAFGESPFGIPLAGCPLEEKISEMNWLKAAGSPIGALAVAMVANPMIAGTGHRICNDCMKACIYQKQAPVNIPEAETRTLKDVLNLPWGFEIYSLLTRWNPMSLRLPVAKPASGRRVLVAGLGPAGYTLAHWLLNDGHTVVGIDGLKIEPLPNDISGRTMEGERVPFIPIQDIKTVLEPLGNRITGGFGGVAEYGITVRWDKNFLKIIRLLLERRERFSMTGGVRLGGQLTVESAFEAGFDHVALCMGAGRPTVIPVPNGLARGVRQASDFLMALQLTGAAKTDSITNLQIRLPVAVIGGGLTAVDAATEALAYYPIQVEKFLSRYETLVAEKGEATVRQNWNEEEGAIANDFIHHALAIRTERTRAESEGGPANISALLNEWGGATVIYRRRLIDSPSYTLNHEEIEKALEEGARFAEGQTPKAVEIDRFGHAEALTVEDSQTGVATTFPAKTILVAAGTKPNTILSQEEPDLIELDGRYFKAVDENGNAIKPEALSKPETPQVLLNTLDDGRAISFWGDLHPSFAGNVVKAMGGAKQGWPVVSRILKKLPAKNPEASVEVAFLDNINAGLRASIHAVNRLTPTIIEVVVHAPLAARAFEPGQFYRLQNFETLAKTVNGTRLAMEGLALTGAWTDPEQGLLGAIVLEMGGSSDLCAHLSPGEPVILMGPTGTPTEIPKDETVLLAGGGLGNAVLFSIGRAMRENGCRVVYFAGYKTLADRYKTDDIEAAADVVIWASDEAPGFTPTRPQDKSFVGNIVDAMIAYQSGEWGTPEIDLGDVDTIIAIGSDRMMAAVTQARHDRMAGFLKPNHIAIGSINSPMQCMMKEICAQCLQVHKDPATGEETVVFSCKNQDQPLDLVDFEFLSSRLRQNSVQEKLTAQWIDRCLVSLQLREASAAE